MAATIETKAPLPSSTPARGVTVAAALPAVRARGPTLDEALAIPFEFTAAQRDQLAHVQSLINIVNTTMDQAELSKASNEADAILLALRRTIEDKLPNANDLLRELRLRERKADDDKRRAEASKAAIASSSSSGGSKTKAADTAAIDNDAMEKESKGEHKDSGVPSTRVDNVDDAIATGVGIKEQIEVTADAAKVYAAIADVNAWWSNTKWSGTGNATTVGSIADVRFDMDRTALRVIKAKTDEHIVWQIDSSSFMFLGKSEWKGTKLVFRITPLETPPPVAAAPTVAAETKSSSSSSSAAAAVPAAAAATPAVVVPVVAAGPRCRVEFIHLGLHRDYHQCYHYTSMGWTHYIGTSLLALINTGTGNPFATNM